MSDSKCDRIAVVRFVLIDPKVNGFTLLYGAKLVVFYYCPGQTCTCPDLPGPQGF